MKYLKVTEVNVTLGEQWSEEFWEAKEKGLYLVRCYGANESENSCSIAFHSDISIPVQVNVDDSFVCSNTSRDTGTENVANDSTGVSEELFLKTVALLADKTTS